MAKFNIDYDREGDDLFLYGEGKSRGSIEMGDLILDFDKEGRLAGIEMLNAVRFLKNSVANGSEKIISKDFLSALTECRVETNRQNNFLFIKIILAGKNAEVACPINAPLIERQSPALAYA